MTSLFAFGGPQDWLIIGALMLLFFGNRLPTAMRSLGQGMNEFKKGLNGVEDETDTKAIS